MQRKDLENKIYDILGHKYYVVFDNSFLKDKEGSWSECDNISRRIVFHEDIPEEWIESCFIHEKLEAVNFIMGLNLPHQIICALEAAEYQIIRANDLWTKE